MGRRLRRRGPRKIFSVPPPSGGRIRAKAPSSPPLGPGWIEVSHFAPIDPRLRPRRLRLCADHDVPADLVVALRVLGYNVLCAAEDGMDGHEDRAVIGWVSRKRRVLLSFNHNDFWNDTRHPLQKLPGIIMVAVPNDGMHLPGVVSGLDLLLSSLADNLPLGFWKETKVRVTALGYRLKRREGGQTVQYEVREQNGRLYFKRKGRPRIRRGGSR